MAIPLYLFPYKRGDGQLSDPDIWTGGKMDRGVRINRNLKTYPPNAEVRKHLGVRGFEALLAYVGELPSGQVDGIFRWKTRRAIKRFQREEGIQVLGFIGPATAAALCFALIDEVERELKIPGHLLFGTVMHESSGDCGIIGGEVPDDRGLIQSNRAKHGPRTPDNISDEQAFDPLWSLPHGGVRMRTFYDEHGDTAGLDPEVRWNAAVLQHHNPQAAITLARTGKYTEPRFQEYVEKVRRRAAQLP